MSRPRLLFLSPDPLDHAVHVVLSPCGLQEDAAITGRAKERLHNFDRHADQAHHGWGSQTGLLSKAPSILDGAVQLGLERAPHPALNGNLGAEDALVQSASSKKSFPKTLRKVVVASPGGTALAAVGACFKVGNSVPGVRKSTQAKW